jgi:hypothetical protein
MFNWHQAATCMVCRFSGLGTCGWKKSIVFVQLASGHSRVLSYEL